MMACKSSIHRSIQRLSGLSDDGVTKADEMIDLRSTVIEEMVRGLKRIGLKADMSSMKIKGRAKQTAMVWGTSLVLQKQLESKAGPGYVRDPQCIRPVPAVPGPAIERARRDLLAGRVHQTQPLERGARRCPREHRDARVGDVVHRPVRLLVRRGGSRHGSARRIPREHAAAQS